MSEEKKEGRKGKEEGDVESAKRWWQKIQKKKGSNNDRVIRP